MSGLGEFNYVNRIEDIPNVLKMKFDLQIACNAKHIPSKNHFKHWITTAIQETNKKHEICIRLVNKDESQQLNSQFRKKNKPTNVLSFSYGKEALPLLGDLIISI